LYAASLRGEGRTLPEARNSRQRYPEQIADDTTGCGASSVLACAISSGSRSMTWAIVDIANFYVSARRSIHGCGGCPSSSIEQRWLRDCPQRGGQSAAYQDGRSGVQIGDVIKRSPDRTAIVDYELD
jgi:hypothetical protein